MPVGVYYNEIDPFAAAWLRELMKAGELPDGEVDERSITDVRADDLRGFEQCHFFAGIGGWAYALKLAGWGERPVWTGSCPCQPFSSAGAQAGGHDPRDLWPVWFELLRECRPRVVFGEQVEAAIGHGWLDRLCDDLEAEGYAVGAVGLPSASVGAFDIRQRLWFVADAEHTERRSVGGHLENERHWAPAGWTQAHSQSGTRRTVRELADADGRHTLNGGLQRGGEHGLRAEDRCLDGRAGIAEQPESGLADDDSSSATRYGSDGWSSAAEEGLRCGPRDRGVVGDSGSQGLSEQRSERGASRGQASTDAREALERAGAPVSFWADCDWLPCADGKARPVEPGTFPLAHGVSARVGRLRGYGNAINPWVAAAVIEAYLTIAVE